MVSNGSLLMYVTMTSTGCAGPRKHSGMANASAPPALHLCQICRQLSSLHELAIVDLSCNLWTGPIPEKLSNLPSLLLMNMSFNEVSGSIPLEKISRMMGSSAFVGNSKLCGEPLKPCADSEGIQRGFELESRSKDKLKWVFLL
ncbi:putative LRR receptor-like serine/threonine-protein kinase [Vitis vinifera]|uniref:Putative LRR receptor-like serine/threonine-protein kinase n=1 Tax=Vitis vinifera TaxID=29760 RepID=A0A438JUP8_VITVI|nr:putative LRR receptor-like serine/threonine-protein kinase [Vitis vinifera]